MAPPESPSGIAQVVERNIRALLARHHREEQQAGWEERLADRITAFTGSMRFVYLHLVLFGVWILMNLPGVPLPHFDPTYVVLAMMAPVEAIFSTFILITQNRMTAQAHKRADLDSQISLLAEHGITRLITLMTAIAERLGVAAAQDPELVELAQDVAPEQVLDTMGSIQNQVADKPHTDKSSAPVDGQRSPETTACAVMWPISDSPLSRGAACVVCQRHSCLANILL